ncbi:uncharacterized protein [Periplaneta americana]|uniref:uncharacterized protein n=1 Tax=Periplaneta americana TaxID=6978 RepID=UPI0037E8697C
MQVAMPQDLRTRFGAIEVIGTLGSEAEPDTVETRDSEIYVDPVVIIVTQTSTQTSDSDFCEAERETTEKMMIDAATQTEGDRDPDSSRAIRERDELKPKRWQHLMRVAMPEDLQTRFGAIDVIGTFGSNAEPDTVQEIQTEAANETRGCEIYMEPIVIVLTQTSESDFCEGTQTEGGSDPDSRERDELKPKRWQHIMRVAMPQDLRTRFGAIEVIGTLGSKAEPDTVETRDSEVYVDPVVIIVTQTSTQTSDSDFCEAERETTEKMMIDAATQTEGDRDPDSSRAIRERDELKPKRWQHLMRVAMPEDLQTRFGAIDVIGTFGSNAEPDTVQEIQTEAANETRGCEIYMEPIVIVLTQTSESDFCEGTQTEGGSDPDSRERDELKPKRWQHIMRVAMPQDLQTRFGAIEVIGTLGSKGTVKLFIF